MKIVQFSSVFVILALFHACHGGPFDTLLNTTPQTFEDAIAVCKKENKVLMVPETGSKLEDVLKGMEGKEVNRLWVGVSRKDSEWKKNSDGQAPRQFFWMDGRPTSDSEASCVEMVAEEGDFNGANLKRWNNINCSEKRPFMCDRF